MKKFILSVFIVISFAASAQTTVQELTPSQSPLKITNDNGYRADSCIRRCFCEPYPVDGNKYWFFYDQYGRDTSVWWFTQDSIIDPWELMDKDVKYYSSSGKIEHIIDYGYYPNTFWTEYATTTYIYNSVDSLIEENKIYNSASNFYYRHLHTFDTQNFKIKSDYWALQYSGSYSYLGNREYTNFPNGKVMSALNYHSDTTGTIELSGLYNYGYDTAWNLKVFIVFSFVGSSYIFQYQDLYEYDANNNKISYAYVAPVSGGGNDTVTFYRYWYNSNNQMDSSYKYECYYTWGEPSLKEIFYYDSLGNQIRWEYHLNYHPWVLMGYEDCYYSKHNIEYVGISEAIPIINNIYPNPAQDNISIDFSQNASGLIRIFNQWGQLLQESKIDDAQSTNITLSSYENGLYYLTFLNENGVLNTKAFTIIR